MCVYVYVSVCVSVCVCVCPCMGVCMQYVCPYMCVYIYPCMYVCVCNIYVRVGVYVWVCVCNMYVSVYVHGCGWVRCVLTDNVQRLTSVCDVQVIQLFLHLSDLFGLVRCRVEVN